MLRDWKKMIVLAAGVGMVAVTPSVKADQFGLEDAGTKPRTFSKFNNAGYYNQRHERRLRVFINTVGAERFGEKVEHNLQNIASDRFRIVHNRNRADVILRLNADVSRIDFKRYSQKHVRDRYKKRIRKNPQRFNGLSYASYDVVKERMTLSYLIDVKVRQNGHRIKMRTFSGQLSQNRKYAENLQGLTWSGWDANVPAPSRKVARLMDAGSRQATRMMKRNLRNDAARDIAYRIANMRVLNKMAQNVRYDMGTAYPYQERPRKGWKKRFLGSLVNHVVKRPPR